MIAKLKPLIPSHRTYVEPFCGAASMLFAKQPASVETINDLNSGVAGFFRVLRDQPEEFMRLARLSEYGRELYLDCKATWQDEPDPVRRRRLGDAAEGHVGGLREQKRGPSALLMRHNRHYRKQETMRQKGPETMTDAQPLDRIAKALEDLVSARWAESTALDGITNALAEIKDELAAIRKDTAALREWALASIWTPAPASDPDRFKVTI